MVIDVILKARHVRPRRRHFLIWLAASPFLVVGGMLALTLNPVAILVIGSPLCVTFVLRRLCARHYESAMRHAWESSKGSLRRRILAAVAAGRGLDRDELVVNLAILCAQSGFTDHVVRLVRRRAALRLSPLTQPFEPLPLLIDEPRVAEFYYPLIVPKERAAAFARRTDPTSAQGAAQQFARKHYLALMLTALCAAWLSGRGPSWMLYVFSAVALLHVYAHFRRGGAGEVINAVPGGVVTRLADGTYHLFRRAECVMVIAPTRDSWVCAIASSRRWTASGLDEARSMCFSRHGCVRCRRRARNR